MEYERRLDARLVLSVVAAGIMSFSGVVVETAMNVTFPTLMAEFHVGTSTVQWMTTSYLLVLAAIVPTSAWMSRRFPTRRVFLVAMAFYISGIACGACAQSFPMLLCGRILEGCGTGIALPLMFNIIQEQAPLQNMGTMMGVGSFVTAMAPAIGPSLGGWVAENLGWRWIFIGLLPVLAVALVMGATTIRQSHQTGPAPFDVAGWVTLVASFASLVFATSGAGERGWGSPDVIALLVAFVALLALFLRRTRERARDGRAVLVSPNVFSHRGFSLSVLALVLVQFCVLGLSFLLSNYSQLVMGHGATEAGSILLPGCVVGALLAPLSGKMLDTLGARPPILGGSLCMLAANVLFLVTVGGAGLQTAGAMGIYVLFAFGQGLSIGNTMTNGLSFLPGSERPDGNAVINTLQQLSGAVGTSVVTTIVQASQSAAGGSQLSASTMAGTGNAYLVLVVVAAGVLVSQLGALSSPRKV